jgi:hypothetical protein
VRGNGVVGANHKPIAMINELYHIKLCPVHLTPLAGIEHPDYTSPPAGTEHPDYTSGK